MKIVLFFIDGLGIGRQDTQYNPSVYSQKHYLDLFQDEKRFEPVPFHGLWKGLDATLGVPGLPQSATGQTAILTGINPAKILGYHLNGFPNKRLREVLMENSILKRIKEMGFTVDFLNTYRPPFFERDLDEKMKRASCSTVSTLASGIPFHSQKDLFSRESICHDLTNEVFLDNGFEAPLFTPVESGQILARAIQRTDFLMFEFFLTDLVGHAQDMNRAKRELQKLEDFLESALSNIDLTQCTFIIISDHGNFEDLSIRSHTKNPALFTVWGQHAGTFFERCNSIQDPYHVILEIAKREAYFVKMNDSL